MTTKTAQDQEVERLREQVAALQADAEQRDAADAEPAAYEHAEAGSGHLEDRLARVAGALSRIPKRGYNKDQSYAFVAQPDILDAVRPALAAERVRFRSELKAMHAEPDGRRTGKNNDGMEWCMWRAEIDFTFSCRVSGHALVDDGPRDALEEDTIRWTGWAYDFGDKGGPKAETSALKTFLIQQFLISTGDDPDVPPSEPQQRSSASSQGASTDTEVRVARRAAMDWNEKLPTGVLGKIARKVAGEGRIMKIDNVPQLQKITLNAERYVANPEAGAAWLAGDAQQQSGEPQPDEAQRQESAGEPDTPPAADHQPSDLPYEPASLPAIDSYDPPLSEDEARQHELGLDPRPSYNNDPDADDTPF